MPATARARITALVVDDEAHARAYLRLVLRSLGVTTVWEATDGEAALAAYAAHEPTVVLLDVNMPVLNGEETVIELARRFSSAAVIVVSAQSEHHQIKRFAEIGVIGYVLKQQPRAVVTEMIAEALDSLDLDGEAA